MNRRHTQVSASPRHVHKNRQNWTGWGVVTERPERDEELESLRATIEHGLGEHEEMKEKLDALTEKCEQLAEKYAVLEERVRQDQVLDEEIFQAGEEKKLRDLGLPPLREPRHRDNGFLSVVPAVAAIGMVSGWALKAASWPATGHAIKAAAYAAGAAKRHAVTAAVAGTVIGGATTLAVVRTVVLVPGPPASPPAAAAPSQQPDADVDTPVALWPSPSRTASPRPHQVHAPKAKPSPSVTPAIPAVAAAPSSPAPTPSGQVPQQSPPSSPPPPPLQAPGGGTGPVTVSAPPVTPPASVAPVLKVRQAASGVPVRVKVNAGLRVVVRPVG